MESGQKEILAFQAKVTDYYRTHGRSLPWRTDFNPYRILVSEIMLQQTQVTRVIPKYRKFLDVFPDIDSLSKATLVQVLSVWQGLGYNRRAKHLLETARIVVTKYGGIVPSDPKLLESLPGIGKATAAAICVYAFNQPLVFIETNVRKVFIDAFFTNRSSISDNEITPLVEKALDRKHPREWYWALMDYGSYIAKIQENPNRRSKTYAKQSPLKGSVREMRATILKLLLTNGALSLNKLQTRFHKAPVQFEKALEGLAHERFVTVAEGAVRITDQTLRLKRDKY